MVNDLKPNLSKRMPDDTQRLLVHYMSSSRTQALIELCITRYIDSFQCSGDTVNTPPIKEETARGTFTASIESQTSPTSLHLDVQRRKRSPPPSPSRPPPIPPTGAPDGPRESSMPSRGRSRSGSSKGIFQTLENYIVACFEGVDCLNGSFLLVRPMQTTRAKSESSMVPFPQNSEQGQSSELNATLSPVDAKTLLLGDFAENGMWWAGEY